MSIRCSETGANRAYRAGDCPVAEDAFNRWITTDIYEHYAHTGIEEIAFGIGKVAHYFAARKAPRLFWAGSVTRKKK